MGTETFWVILGTSQIASTLSRQQTAQLAVCSERVARLEHLRTNRNTNRPLSRQKIPIAVQDLLGRARLSKSAAVSSAASLQQCHDTEHIPNSQAQVTRLICLLTTLATAVV